MAAITLNGYTEALLQVFNEASLKTDAGVQAVMTYLLEYSGQSVEDLAGMTGFDEAKLRDYLSALGDLVESDGAIWRPSAQGRAEIGHSLAAAVNSVTSAPTSGAAGLTAVEAKRWEEVKRIVMDTAPNDSMSVPLRAQYEHWFNFTDSNLPPKTSGPRHLKPGELDANITFNNQGNRGITIHRPGTQPAVYFDNLRTTFQVKKSDSLQHSDGQLIHKALGLGLTFW